MKKGLALVLAAATALTFAPVASLSNGVQAEAAIATQLTYSDPTNSGTLSWQNSSRNYYEINLSAGTYVIQTSTKGNLGSGDLTVAAGTAANGNPAAAVSSIDGVYTSTDTNQKAGAFNVTTAGIVKFTVTDPTQNGSVTYTIVKTSDSNSTVTDAAVTTSDDYVTKHYQTAGSFTVVASDISNGYTWNSTNTPVVSNVEKKTDGYGNVTYEIKQGTTSAADTFAVPSGTPAITSSNAKLVVTSSPAYVTATVGSGATWNVVTFKGSIEGSATVHVAFVATTDIVSGGSYTIKSGSEIASADYNFVVTSSTTNITDIHWALASGIDKYQSGAYVPTYLLQKGTLDTDYSVGSEMNLDLLVTKTAKIETKAAGAVTYSSSNPSVATVDASGNVTAVASGYATIQVQAAASGSLKSETKTISVVVSEAAKDVITATVDGKTVGGSKTIELDLSTSTASNAKKTAKIVAKSVAGSALTFKLDGDSSIANVSSDGTVTAGATKGSVNVVITSPDNGKIQGGSLTVKVNVNEKPESIITQDDITLDLSSNKTVTLAPTSSTGSDAKFSYELDPDTDDAYGVVDLKGNVLTALAYGQTTLKITQPETSTTRVTEKKVKVTVVGNAAKAVSGLKVASSQLTIEAGKTASAGASTTASGAAITYTSDNTSVATVAADGTITAVAPGTAVITVKSAETDTMNAVTAYVIVNVPVVYENPAQVTGVKVKNAKGAKVTVTFKKDKTNPNMKYYVQKQTQKKKSGKSVGSNKTTLSVKSGKSVKVRVKAYYYDANGVKHVGKYSAWTSILKTDKK